jgi:aspartyl-tRNA(Asn)/glutamyl-tRNA(Gln) amidotransferase subunit A
VTESMSAALTIDDVKLSIAERQTTATALVQDFYTRIRKEDSEICAFLTLCEDRALAQARRIDALLAEGKPLPPLAGVPVAIKDVMVTSGVRTTAGSKILITIFRRMTVRRWLVWKRRAR